MRPALLRLTAPRGPLPGPEALCGALPWLPLGLAALYVVALLRTLGAVVGSIYSSADVVSAPYIGELYARAPHGAEVVLGNIPWYSALWFETATRAFPAHRVIWEVAPWILTLIGAALAPGSHNKLENGYLETALIADLTFPADASRQSCLHAPPSRHGRRLSPSRSRHRPRPHRHRRRPPPPRFTG